MQLDKGFPRNGTGSSLASDHDTIGVSREEHMILDRDQWLTSAQLHKESRSGLHELSRVTSGICPVPSCTAHSRRYCYLKVRFCVHSFKSRPHPTISIDHALVTKVQMSNYTYTGTTTLTQDHRVRVIKAEGEGSAVAFEATTDGSVGALCSFSRSGEGADQVAD